MSEIERQAAEMRALTTELRALRATLVRMDATITCLERRGPERTGKAVAAEVNRAAKGARR